MNPDNYVGKDFLSMPKAHHHVSRLLVLIVILAIIAVAIWGYAYLNSPTYTSDTNANAPHVLTDAERQAIMERPSTTQIQNPSLTDSQRAAIMNKTSMNKIQNPSLTDGQRSAIMYGTVTK